MKKATDVRPLPSRLSMLRTKSLSFLASPVRFVDRRPMLSFFISIAVVLILIVISNIITKPKPQAVETTPTVKNVSLYRIGSAPKITVSAQTRKSGVIQIVALNSGIINKINVQEGQTVRQGQQLLSMSTNYNGDNALSIQRQSAATAYQGALNLYPKKKETIEQQIEQAEKTEDNSNELRKITQSSVDETQTLVNQDTDILNTLKANLATAQQGTDSAAILGLKELVAQYQGATNLANQSLRSAQYNGNSDNPPAEIASLTKEIAKKQFETQLKQLQIDLEVSRLSAAMAAINESTMFPTSPFPGTVQRVFVKEKQSVSPGTPLFVLSQSDEETPITAVAFVSADVAARVSRIEPSVLHIGNKATYVSIPSFVSTEAVDGTLYAIYYPIPPKYSKDVVSEGFVSVDIPVGYTNTTMIATFVPLDAVYQTQETSYVFVEKDGLAISRDVQLGSVYGGSVEVLSGLKDGDKVILNRDIIAGDKVQTQ